MWFQKLVKFHNDCLLFVAMPGQTQPDLCLMKFIDMECRDARAGEMLVRFPIPLEKKQVGEMQTTKVGIGN